MARVKITETVITVIAAKIPIKTTIKITTAIAEIKVTAIKMIPKIM